MMTREGTSYLTLIQPRALTPMPCRKTWLQQTQLGGTAALFVPELLISLQALGREVAEVRIKYRTRNGMAKAGKR